MSKGQILLVTRPAEGGILKHLRSVIRHLSGDFTFIVACPQASVKDYEDLPCTVAGLPLQKRLHPWYDLKSMRQLHAIIGSGSVFAVHAHGFKAGLIARPIARLHHIPCLMTVHSDFAHAQTAHLKGLMHLTERAMSRWTRKYITVSEWMSGYLNDTFGIKGEKIVVIPNGLDGDYAEAAGDTDFPFPMDTPVVGTVARLAPQKGLHVLLDAAALLAARYPALHFAVAGDGPLRDQLTGRAKQLGLEERVRFFGYMPTVTTFLKRLQVFVLPSLSEAQGIAVLEAMRAGCPVIASRIGGLNEVIRDGENGLLVSAGDASGLASAISTCLENPGFAQQLAKQAQIDVEKYSLHGQLQQTKAVYEQILEGRIRQ